MFIELGFWPPGWDLGLQVGIWATRQELGLGFKSKGGRTEKKDEKEKEEKIPHICESIGHRPLRGNFNHNLLKQGTGTADHLTLLRLFMVRIDLIRKF